MAEKEAFCLLLWVHQGGQVNDRGRKVVTVGSTASGYCDDPTDCYRCPLMQQEISRHPQGHANWVCPACLPEIARRAKMLGRRNHLTGHYAEGQCQYIGCVRPPRVEYDSAVAADAAEVSWTPADLVDRPKGYSRFLQLVIGNINT